MAKLRQVEGETNRRSNKKNNTELTDKPMDLIRTLNKHTTNVLTTQKV